MPLIELKNVSKTYRIGRDVEVPALRGLSLSIEAGEFVAIMGPSGSGKSTLLAILGLLDKSDRGEYFLMSRGISGIKDSEYARLRNRFFGFVFQMFNLLPTLKVIENVMLPFIYMPYVPAERRADVLVTLKRIGLFERINHKPNQLSGGQMQRVAIARALANQPIVILADEPTGNLDSKSSAEIMEIFKQLNQQGKTIIMVTHEHDIAAYASRVLTLSDGKIVGDEKRRVPEAVGQKGLAAEHKQDGRPNYFGSLGNYCYEAVLSIVNNKFRSALSILGVLIGVAAVITMLALGTGAEKQMEERFQALGTNILTVRFQGRAGGISLGSETPTRFNFEDLVALQRIQSIEYAVPYVQGRVQAVYENKNWNTSVVGTSVDYQALRDVPVLLGRFFNQREAEGRSKVAVLGQKVARELFGDSNPMGQLIKVNRVSFSVVGVLKEQGQMGWRNLDDQIFIPVKTAMYRLLGTDYISYFDIKVKDADDTTYVSKAITDELVRLHRLAEEQRQNVEIVNMAQIQETARSVIATLSILLGVVAAVSLLVGGIGIMNIMLVMIMERIHEIGLRKAIGAQKSDIMIQFLVESVIICLFGGALGILFGILLSLGLSSLAQWVIYISFGSIVLAFGFSLAVGIVFGLWPAWRAAQLLPIEALRYE